MQVFRLFAGEMMTRPDQNLVFQVPEDGGQEGPGEPCPHVQAEGPRRFGRELGVCAASVPLSLSPSLALCDVKVK